MRLRLQSLRAPPDKQVRLLRNRQVIGWFQKIAEATGREVCVRLERREELATTLAHALETVCAAATALSSAAHEAAVQPSHKKAPG